MTESDDAFTVTLKVTNTGKTYSGKETVQVYFQSPYTDYDKANGIEKAAAELCGFAKTDVLAPGASEDVTITVKKSELRTYDANNAKTYILDAGDYYFTAATDSHNAVNNILAAKGYTVAGTNGRMTEDAMLLWSGSGPTRHWIPPPMQPAPTAPPSPTCSMSPTPTRAAMLPAA